MDKWLKLGNTYYRRYHARPVVITLMFLVLFFLMQTGFQNTRDTAVERFAIDTVTVQPAAWLIRQFSGPAPVIAQGHRIVSPGIRLSVLNGCEGFEGIFLIIAAILAFPARLNKKLLGIIAGTGLMYGLNQLRIALLFYTLHYDRSWFNPIHGYIGPTLIIIIGGLFFFYYLSRLNRIDEQRGVV
ncbi:MAG: archaeosortase/exosortase family protein [Gammaproteobacteria bacterium]|nr:archaeosortase/exosortase family protein [Gammaproteobacteria bacterium]